MPYYDVANLVTVIENTGVSTFLLLIFVPFFLFSINMEGLCG